MIKKLCLVTTVIAMVILAVVMLRPQPAEPPAVESNIEELRAAAPSSAQHVDTAALDPQIPAESRASVPDADPNAAAIALARQYCGEPPEVVQALPGVPGFELRSGFGHLSQRLASETTDPVWAIRKETEIREIIGEALPMEGLEVECRMASCGIVLVGEFVGLEASQREFFQGLPGLLASRLNFAESWNTGRRGAVNRPFTAIYLLAGDGRAQLAPAPAREQAPLRRMPALPGIAGYELPCPQEQSAEPHPAMFLATEPADPGWASPMEARILGELSRLLSGTRVSQIHVACRSRTCGIVLDSSAGMSSMRSLSETATSLARDLGFGSPQLTMMPMNAGTAVATIYLVDGNSPDRSLR